MFSRAAARFVLLALAATVAGCDCSGGYLIYTPPVPDAGVLAVPDSGVLVVGDGGGVVDPDAGDVEPDAGVLEPDAGEVEPDAGEVEPDAGVVVATDAGAPDAGALECDPSRTRQCIGDDAVICSSAGSVVEREACVVWGCGVERGRCNECDPGTSSCDGDELVTCRSDGTPDPATEACAFDCGETDAGVARCNQCEPNAFACAGSELASCGSGGEVESSVTCDFGCNGANLPPICNECDPAAQEQCIGDVATTCSPQGFIAAEEDCGVDSCNSLVGRCNVCEPGTTFCVAGGIAACEPDGTISADVTSCTRGCVDEPDAGPACLACTPGATECHDNDLVSCDADGEIVASVACEDGCRQVTGADGRCNECAPSSTACDGDDSVVCTADGYEATRATCTFGCNAADGTCNSCNPSTSECHEDTFVTCDAAGDIVDSDDCTALSDTCNVGVCTQGGCEKDPSPKHDTFCGEEMLCCSGTCLPSDESNCGACGNVCATPTSGCNPADVCFHNTCIDVGIIVINELMIDPSATGDPDEWVEVYNSTSRDIDLREWVLEDDGTDAHNITGLTNVVVPASGYAVLVKNNVTAAACGVSGVYTYGTFDLGNSGDEVVIGVAGCEVDRFAYGSSFEVSGASKALKVSARDATSNDDAANWCTSTSELSCGDKGTPGAENDCQ